MTDEVLISVSCVFYHVCNSVSNQSVTVVKIAKEISSGTAIVPLNYDQNPDCWQKPATEWYTTP